jgi:predicted nuclease of predicted toxin-antitoxin system
MIFFVDINLPSSFEYFAQDNFLFIKDISDTLPDIEIWKTALENNYTILTRDKDFYYRSMQAFNKAPKIVLFRLGNVKNNELFIYFKQHWIEIENLLQKHRLIVLWPNEIQIVI